MRPTIVSPVVDITIVMIALGFGLAVVLMVALDANAGPRVAQSPNAADVPETIYAPDRISPQTMQAIAEEEAVTPKDGSRDDAVLESHPSDTVPSDVSDKSEADQVLEDSKKDAPVTAADIDSCMKEWDPQTQMTKEEWANSCRSTLKYFPEQH